MPKKCLNNGHACGAAVTLAAAALLCALGGCVTHTVKDNSVGAQMGGLLNTNSNGGWGLQHGKAPKIKKSRPIPARSYSAQTNMHGGPVNGSTQWSTWGPPTWPGK